MLSQHMIDRVQTLKIRNRYTRLNGKNSRRGEHAYGDEFAVKVLYTDQGAMGWGLTGGAFYNQDKSIDSLVLGKRVVDLIDPDTGILNDALAPFDFALHDLAGVILSMPVYRLLGNRGRNPVRCYDGAILMDDISPDSCPGGLKAVLDECRADWALGYRMFKLKIGRGPKWMPLREGIKRDIEVTRLVKEFFPESRIMVDCNDQYTPETIKEYIDQVADIGLYWIEEPFRENEMDFAILKEHLQKRSPETMIADGESWPDEELLFSLHEKKLLDVLQMDIHGWGFTKWRRTLKRAEGQNALISPHNWGFKLKTHYTAAFAAGCPLVDAIEGVVDETEGVDFSGYALENGRMFVPEQPGFGMKLIWGQEV